MTPTGSLETEQKYDADTATPLPELLEIPGVERATLTMHVGTNDDAYVVK